MDRNALRAQVILEWKAGATKKGLARTHNVAESTVRDWLKGVPRTEVTAPPPAPKKNARPTIDDLAYDLVSETFLALVAIARQAQDPEWLKQQPADGLHLFFGVGADKVIRLYEAINPERLRELEAGRAGQPGGAGPGGQ